jgi:hypothetical protein
MATIHDEIDTYLAADLHGELLEDERNALHTHLVECATCRKAHQETNAMNKILEETLAQEKPDPAFEQRMLSSFRNRIPQRGGFVKLLLDLMRLRAAQITAVAAVLLALVQVGRIVTGENATASRDRERLVEGYLAAQPVQRPLSSSNEVGALSKSDNRRDNETDQLAAGKTFARGQVASAPAAPQTEAKDKKQERAEVERTVVTGSNIAPAKEVEPNLVESPASALANRKLIRNATVEIEIVSFDTAVQKITAFANEEHGYVATTNSQKQANGKLKGQVVVKIVPENLDRFLQSSRTWRLKNQTSYRGRDEGVFRHRCASQEHTGDGAAVDRHLENEDPQSFRFAAGREGTWARARGDRENARRIEILGFAGAIRDSHDFSFRDRHGGSGCVSA